METKVLMPVEEYLRTSFDGADRDYIDGEVLERNVGEHPHSEIQWILGGLFIELSKRARVHGRPELRIQVSPTRFRVADFALYAGPKPSVNISKEPPLVAIEVLSREDRMGDIVDRLKDYADYGVPNIWLVDPWRRTLYIYDAGDLHQAQRFELPEFSFRIEHGDLFS